MIHFLPRLYTPPPLVELPFSPLPPPYRPVFAGSPGILGKTTTVIGCVPPSVRLLRPEWSGFAASTVEARIRRSEGGQNTATKRSSSALQRRTSG